MQTQNTVPIVDDIVKRSSYQLGNNFQSHEMITSSLRGSHKDDESEDDTDSKTLSPIIPLFVN